MYVCVSHAGEISTELLQDVLIELNRNSNRSTLLSLDDTSALQVCCIVRACKLPFSFNQSWPAACAHLYLESCPTLMDVHWCM